MCYNICPYCGAHLDPGERCDCAGQEEPTPSDGTSAGGNEMNIFAVIQMNGRRKKREAMQMLRR